MMRRRIIMVFALDNWTRVNNDVNGNPRFVIHYTSCMPEAIRTSGDIHSRYDATVKLMNKIGGRRFHNRQYGGGIVFQSYSLQETNAAIERIKAAYDKKHLMR
jgi:hypothetical protein